MTIRLSSGTSNRCLGPSRTLFWPTQPKERSTMCSGPQLSRTGSPSAITTAWRYSVCSLAGASPTRPGLVCFSLCPFPPHVRRTCFQWPVCLLLLYTHCVQKLLSESRPVDPRYCAGLCCVAHRSPGLGFTISLLSSLLLQLNISVYMFVSCCVHEQYEHWLRLCPVAPCLCLCLRQSSVSCPHLCPC